MRIYVPSRDRQQLKTVKTLRNVGVLDQITVVVPSNQYDAYVRAARVLGNTDVLPVPEQLKGIANTRDYIIETTDAERIVMMDDDLLFYERLAEGRLTKMLPDSARTMLDWLDDALTTRAHASVTARLNYQARKGLQETCTRPYRLYGYHVPTIKMLGLKHAPAGWDREKPFYMDDFHMCLSLIERGYENVVSNLWAQEHSGGSHAPGGAASYRTIEGQAECARALHAAHPRFVRLAEKTTKTAWGGTASKPVTRLDVVISWKKALGALA